MRFLSQLFAALAIGLLGYWLGTRHASATRDTRVATVQSISPTPKLKTKGTNRQTAGYHPGMAAALLAALEAVPDTNERDRMIVRRVAALQGDERRMMAEELLAMPEGRKNFEFVLDEVISQWASDEATVALAWLEALPQNLPQLKNQLDNITTSIAYELAKSDGPKALQLLRGIGNGSMRMEKAFRNWVLHNPNEAVAAVATLDDVGQERAIRGISEGLLNLDPQTAMESCKNLSPKLRAQAQFQVLQDWVGSDTAAAATWLQTVSHEDQLILNAIERGIGRVILYVAKEEPALAIKLLEKLEPSLRYAALPEIADGWASRDFDAAWKWAASLTSPREQTAALVIMGGSAADQPIETILKLAGEITGDAGSQQFLVNCCRGMLSSDQPAKFADILRQFSPTQLNDIANEAGLFSSPSFAPKKTTSRNHGGQQSARGRGRPHIFSHSLGYDRSGPGT